MLVLYLSPEYLIGMGVWLAALGLFLMLLLRARGRSHQAPRRLMLVNAGLSLAMLLGVMTAGELAFACFADFSDTFSVSNVSKRWLAVHVDGEKNENGFRDRNELTTFVPGGKKRIIFLGDSFTAGHGIRRMEDRFTDLIAARFEREQPGQFVVANMALPAYDALSVAKLAKAELLQRHYEMAAWVYVYNLNDVDTFDPHTAESLRAIQSSEPTFFLFRDTYLLNWLYFRLVAFRNSGAQSYYENLRRSYESEPWQRVQGLLANVHRQCVDQGVDFRMVIFPFVSAVGESYPFREAHARIVEFCKAEKIPVLDLEPVFRTHAGEDLVVSRFDAHPNERAHAIAAQAIEDQLLDDFFQPTQSQKHPRK
ncbi:MAG TPA: SGNH/GDSL hydrolase family protein [Planctomycetaceae bacterium]|nr:SGNH/GDSL hydrolase family protein [Planctomycetaceae bacterium]